MNSTGSQSTRIRCKALRLVAKSQQGLTPKYLCELMSKQLSARSSRLLRSADRSDLLVPWSRTSLSQNRVFAVVGPALWNDPPPPALRSAMLKGCHLRLYVVSRLFCLPAQYLFCPSR